MSERLPESHNKVVENNETHESSKMHERIRELERKGESESKKQSENLNKARSKVEQIAKHQENKHIKAEKEHQTFSPSAKSQQKKIAFKQTMDRTQAKLSPSSRIFSKVIHHPVIEKVSDVTAQTVFRPSLTLGVSLGALIGGSIFYGFAKYYGFNLSGTEFIACGVVGGLIGLIWELAGFLAKKLFAR